MSNVISIFKNDKQVYLRRLTTTPLQSLLAEMVHFQDGFAKTKTLTKDGLITGIALFSEVEKRATTIELRILAGSYRRNLEELLKRTRYEP
jgi:hypothetical protein